MTTVLIERIPLVRAQYLLEMSYEDYKIAVQRPCKSEAERREKFDKLIKLCREVVSNNGTTVRKYFYSKDMKSIGRRYASGGIPGLMREVRGFLMQDVSTDLDMKNAHPVILKYLCKKDDISCPHLVNYVENRETILCNFDGMSREDAKEVYLKAINKDSVTRSIKYDDFRNFDKEMKTIQKALTALPQYQVICNTMPADRKHNKLGSKLNRILVTYENDILDIAHNLLKTKGLEVAALAFDGCLVYGNHYDNADLLRELEQACETAFPGLNMQWSFKTHDTTSIVMPDDWTPSSVQLPQDLTVQGHFATDDTLARDIVLKTLHGQVHAGKDGRLFMKKNRVWIGDERIIHDALLNHILECDISFPAEGDKPPRKFCQNVKNAKNVREAVVAKLRSSPNFELYEKFHTTTQGRLCFLDGVLCFRSRDFYPWDDPRFAWDDYFTTVQINYDIEDTFTHADATLDELVKTTIFHNVFDKPEWALKFIARAIAGHSGDKVWATYVGSRNSGKGVLFEALHAAFGNYVGAFSLDNLLCKREGSNVTTSRELYWLLELEFTRLAISQEIPEPKEGKLLNGQMLKKVAGGGDILHARRNFDRRDSEIRSDATYLIMGNNFLESTTPDTTDMQLEFESNKQFKSEEEITSERESGTDERVLANYAVIDPNLKHTVKTIEWRRSMLRIVMHYYEDTPVPIIRDIEDEEKFGYADHIFQVFNLTRNLNDMVTVKEVEDHLPVSDKRKLAMELTKLGIVKRKCAKAGPLRQKWCYCGLKLLRTEDEDYDDTTVESI